MAVRDVFAPKPSKVTDAQVDQVKETMEHINVVDQTIMTADKLAGGPGYRQELERQDAKLSEMERQKDEQAKELHETQMQLLTKELGAKIDELKHGGPRPIGEQLAEIQEVAGKLGLAPTAPKSTIQELGELMTFVNSINPARSIADQIREAKEMIQVLDGEKPPSAEMPASIALQMKQMDYNLQIQLKNMEDARDVRDKEWNLKLKQFETDTELKRQELAQKLAEAHERNQMLSGGIEKVGAVVARGMMESGGGAGIGGGAEAAGPKIASQVIEVAMGEFGETTCPSCSGIIPIARDAVKAVCPGCSTIYPVKRISMPVGVEE